MTHARTHVRTHMVQIIISRPAGWTGDNVSEERPRVISGKFNTPKETHLIETVSDIILR